jgi:hypothetical protein
MCSRVPIENAVFDKQGHSMAGGLSGLCATAGNGQTVRMIRVEGWMNNRVLVWVLLMSLSMVAVALGQAHQPVVSIVLTLPQGRTIQLSAPESGLATTTLQDGTEFGFRPTIQDGKPWTRVVVTIFKMSTATEPTHMLGDVEVRTGGTAVQSKTNPSFRIAVPQVTSPTPPTAT